MKISFSVFLIAVIFLGCEKISLPTTVETPSSSGKIYFAFDKQNAPVAVKTISVTLFRSGFEPLEKTISIISDSSAAILFENIAVGVWGITVNAKNEEGKIIFTGTSTALVVENSVTQVNIVLNPVPAGVGSVQIHVVWNYTPTSQWVDYSSSPVLSKTGNTLDHGGVGQPKILFDDGLYYMFYQNYGVPGTIGYAVSENGNTWVRPDSNIIMQTKNLNGWNIIGISTGPAYKVSGKYYLLFQGYDGSTIQTGLAVSTDKKKWVQQSTPVLKTMEGERFIVGCDVEEIQQQYLLYYFVKKFNGETSIGIAFSTNGILWERKTEPIMIKSQQWETGGVSYPSVIKTSNGYTMLYTNDSESYAGNAFGTATSADGINWTKNQHNPVFRSEQTVHKWASGGIVYPYLTMIAGKERFYYTGVKAGGEWSIGFASKK